MDTEYTKQQLEALDYHSQQIRQLNQKIEWHREAIERIENENFEE